MKVRLSDIIKNWEGIPCPVKKCRPIDPNIKSYRIETPEQRKELQELLTTDKSITGLKYDCESIEREVILTRELK